MDGGSELRVTGLHVNINQQYSLWKYTLAIEMVLIIRPVSANLTNDTETVGNMDSYVKIYLGAEMFKTAICKEGGKTPSWTETFRSNSAEMVLRVQVWDDDTFTDDFVGEGTFNLQQLYNRPSNRPENEWIDLFYQNKPAGRILLTLQIQGTNNQFGGNVPMGGQWNNGPQPMNGGGWGQPPNGGGWGNAPPANNGGWGQPANNAWGQQPGNGGWGNPPPANNGWGNNGW